MGGEEWLCAIVVDDRTVDCGLKREGGRERERERARERERKRERDTVRGLHA